MEKYGIYGNIAIYGRQNLSLNNVVLLFNFKDSLKFFLIQYFFKLFEDQFISKYLNF